ncbi:hypothetical protein HaLaN_05191, partial [Haematococcus lacustris]
MIRPTSIGCGTGYMGPWTMVGRQGRSSLHESFGKPKLLEKATARLKAHRVTAKMKWRGSDKQKKDPGMKLKASRSPQGKQRQERRDGWDTKRRQCVEQRRVIATIWQTQQNYLALSGAQCLSKDTHLNSCDFATCEARRTSTLRHAV